MNTESLSGMQWHPGSGRWEVEGEISPPLLFKKGNKPVYAPPEFQPREQVFSSFPGMNLHDFVEQTVKYETMPGPFNRRLRQATWVGMALILAGLVASLLLPSGSVSGVAFFVLLSNAMGTILGLLSSLWTSCIDTVLLISGLVLLATTRNLQNGKPWQHYWAFAQALCGAGNSLVLLFLFAIVLLNLIFWMAVIVLAILVVIVILCTVLGVLIGMGRGGRNTRW
jgi:hypothetical protein